MDTDKETEEKGSVEYYCAENKRLKDKLYYAMSMVNSLKNKLSIAMNFIDDEHEIVPYSRIKKENNH